MSKIKFVSSTRIGDTAVIEQVVQPPVEPYNSKIENVTSAWKCHNCSQKGHIKPFCHKLYGYPICTNPSYIN